MLNPSSHRPNPCNQFRSLRGNLVPDQHRCLFHSPLKCLIRHNCRSALLHHHPHFISPQCPCSQSLYNHSNLNLCRTQARAANTLPLQPPLQPPQQPPLPPQPRPQIQPFFHQVHTQMRPNLGFQHPGGQQMHPSQPMSHPGTVPPAGMGRSFLQGQPPLPNQPLPPSLYHVFHLISRQVQQNAGGPHLGMEFNQVGSSSQVDRGPNWRPGMPEAKGPNFPGPPLVASPMGPINQPPRPPSLTPEVEKALLQQVMSLTPEQISMLPADQRNQVLQLQQMLRR